MYIFDIMLFKLIFLIFLIFIFEIFWLLDEFFWILHFNCIFNFWLPFFITLFDLPFRDIRNFTVLTRQSCGYMDWIVHAMVRLEHHVLTDNEASFWHIVYALLYFV